MTSVTCQNRSVSMTLPVNVILIHMSRVQVAENILIIEPDGSFLPAAGGGVEAGAGAYKALC